MIRNKTSVSRHIYDLFVFTFIMYTVIQTTQMAFMRPIICKKGTKVFFVFYSGGNRPTTSFDYHEKIVVINE